MKPVTNYMSIAPAKERQNDILFLGGQKVGDLKMNFCKTHNVKEEQDFSALQRIEREFMLVLEDNIFDQHLMIVESPFNCVCECVLM